MRELKYIGYFDGKQTLSFLDNECWISDPTQSTCERLTVSPEQYGFAVTNMGGGETAWHQQFILDGRTVDYYIGQEGSHEFTNNPTLYVQDAETEAPIYFHELAKI